MSEISSKYQKIISKYQKIISKCNFALRLYFWKTGKACRSEAWHTNFSSPPLWILKVFLPFSIDIELQFNVEYGAQIYSIRYTKQVDFKNPKSAKCQEGKKESSLRWWCLVNVDAAGGIVLRPAARANQEMVSPMFGSPTFALHVAAKSRYYPHTALNLSLTRSQGDSSYSSGHIFNRFYRVYDALVD